jgi:hypothetical protein
MWILLACLERDPGIDICLVPSLDLEDRMRKTDHRSQRLKTADDYTQATFVCPACRDRVLATKAEAHLARKHRSLSKGEYLALVKQALQEGRVRFEMSGRHDATANPTKRYAEVKKLAKGGVRAIYRG